LSILLICCVFCLGIGALDRWKRKPCHLEPGTLTQWFAEHWRYDTGFRLLFARSATLPYLGTFGILLVAFVIVPWLLAFVASAIDGTLTIEGEESGILEDVNLPITFLVVAVGLYLFRLIMDLVPAAFESIAKAVAPSPEARAFLARELADAAAFLLQTKDRRGWYGLGFDFLLWLAAVGMVTLAFWATGGTPPDALRWGFADHSWGNLVYTMYWGIVVGYFVPVLIAYMVRLMWVMRSVGYSLCRTRFEGRTILRIRPLHPDGACGLGSFGNLAWRMDLLLMPVMIAIVAWSSLLDIGVSDPVVVAVTAMAAFVAIPVFFFVPLQGLHRAMSAAKGEEIERLAWQFDSTYSALEAHLASPDFPTEERRAEYDSLHVVTLLYDRARRIPVWPFDSSRILSIAAYVFIPLVLVLLEIRYG
jgi:hypothetical protein